MRQSGDRGASRGFVLDHLEGELAVGTLLDGGRADLPRSLLPSTVREGDVLSFETLEESPGTVLLRVRIDEEASRMRRAEAASRLDRLKRGDPGGDLEL